MTRKQKRLSIVLAGMLGLGAATALVLTAFEDNLVFFYSPSDIIADRPAPQQRIRLGGLVEEGSLGRAGDGATVTFAVTDTAETVPVRFAGILPDLFREGQGVVAEGRFAADGVFDASEVLAKHDENYMPREVADALKKTGQWQGDGQE